MRRERFEIVGIRRQYRPSRLGGSHDQCVYRGAPARTAAKKRGSSSETLSYVLDDVARLEQPVFCSVARRVTLKALDQHDRRNAGWPQAFFAKREEEG